MRALENISEAAPRPFGRLISKPIKEVNSSIVNDAGSSGQTSVSLSAFWQKARGKVNTLWLNRLSGITSMNPRRLCRMVPFYLQR